MIYGKQEVSRNTKLSLLTSQQYVCRSGLILKKNQLICQRCGTITAKKAASLPNKGGYYCPACVLYGRITQEDHLVVAYPDQEEVLSPESCRCHWPGKLTSLQQEIAAGLQKCFRSKQRALVWGVTGSGKTEMLFDLLEEALQKQAKIAIASPRIDVCRELYPRIQKAFPDIDVLLRYGEAEEAWRDFFLLVCTTHQLLHFYQAFDLLIIDECDAFPYEGNQQLAYGVRQAVKTKGCQIYLTATPTEEVLKQAKQENWQIFQLANRHHNRPLVEPKLRFWENWRQLPFRKRNLVTFADLCQRLLQQNRLLIFCPEIAYMLQLEQALQGLLPEIAITSVSAKDLLREEKIQQMRQKKWQLLLTTTVLERGVTFANVSVIVVGAEHVVFTKSALVQIAGRVDRLATDAHGEVWFFYQEMTTAIRKAQREIRQLNQKARRF